MKRYNKSLIYEDKSLAQEIEMYLKNKEAADQMKRDRAEAEAHGLDEIELADNDYAEFREAIQNDKEIDQTLEIEEEDE